MSFLHFIERKHAIYKQHSLVYIADLIFQFQGHVTLKAKNFRKNLLNEKCY